MALTLSTPHVDQVGDVIAALRDWQSDDAPFQLHPGDIGWHWQLGADSTAAHLRTWHRDGRVVAVGLLDEPGLVRLTSAPAVRHDERVATRIAADLDDPQHGVLPAGAATVEAPTGALVHEALAANGWSADEVWTPLRRDLSAEVEETSLQVVQTGPDQVDDRIAVHRSAFDSARFDRSRWEAVTSGVPYADARSLLGHDEQGTAVAMITVWSAGPGRPGLIEPMGVHRDHWGHGYGRAICLAGAAALRELGASSASVATPNANTGAIATYAAAGFTPLAERVDSARSA